MVIEERHMLEPPDTVRQWFVDAGWQPGRVVAVSPSVPPDHPAWEILAAFGGLVILERDPEPDPDWPPIEELVFRELHPCPAITEVWGRLLGTQLIGIAGVHNDHAELYIATDGRCFGASCMHDAVYYRGESFGDAIEGILLRRRARPMLRPDQMTVTLYGERFTPDSPELYRYR